MFGVVVIRTIVIIKGEVKVVNIFLLLYPCDSVFDEIVVVIVAGKILQLLLTIFN